MLFDDIAVVANHAGGTKLRWQFGLTLNGGVMVLLAISLAVITSVGATGSNNGWYNYNSATNVVSPIAGKVLVIKTHDGKYAKMEILNYYQDAPANPTGVEPSRYYKFNFVYQPNGTKNF